jgi:hypothetical protein
MASARREIKTATRLRGGRSSASAASASPVALSLVVRDLKRAQLKRRRPRLANEVRTRGLVSVRAA